MRRASLRTSLIFVEDLLEKVLSLLFPLLAEHSTSRQYGNRIPWYSRRPFLEWPFSICSQLANDGECSCLTRQEIAANAGVIAKSRVRNRLEVNVASNLKSLRINPDRGLLLSRKTESSGARRPNWRSRDSILNS